MDLKDRASFDEEDLKRVADECDAPYLCTSAKTGANVREAFRRLAVATVGSASSGGAEPAWTAVLSILGSRTHGDPLKAGLLQDCKPRPPDSLRRCPPTLTVSLLFLRDQQKRREQGGHGDQGPVTREKQERGVEGVLV